MSKMNFYPKTTQGQGKWIAVIVVMVTVILIGVNWKTIKGWTKPSPAPDDDSDA